MPSFAGATGWLNSESPGPAELRGHVVLVNVDVGLLQEALPAGDVSL
jgi:hypothetical protein